MHRSSRRSWLACAGACTAWVMGSRMALAAAETLRPIRRAEGNSVISPIDPAVKITVPDGARYAGAERFVLFGVADCEVHVFFEADASKLIQRVYWIQFEGFLTSKPNLRYERKSQREESLGDLSFATRPRFGPTADATEKGSDAERVFTMLQRQGYRLPAQMMNVTFIHYLDETMRKELMIIVTEDMAPMGKTSDDLIDGDKPKAEWGQIAESLIARAKRKLRVERLAG
jgi:hypothetical protein